MKAVYLRASGDRTPGSNFWRVSSTAPDSHRFLGLVNAFPQLRNIERVGASSVLRRTVLGWPTVATIDYSFFRRVETADMVYPVVVSSADRVLGHEVDFGVSVEALSTVAVQAGLGILYSGSAFSDMPAHAYLGHFSAQVSFDFACLEISIVIVEFSRHYESWDLSFAPMKRRN